MMITYGCACPPPLPPPHSQGRCPRPGWSSPGSPSGLPLTVASHVASGNPPGLWPSHVLWKTLWMEQSTVTVKLWQTLMLIIRKDAFFGWQWPIISYPSGRYINTREISDWQQDSRKFNTYPLNTPKTKLRTKKDPKMTRLTKYTHGSSKPIASFI